MLTCIKFRRNKHSQTNTHRQKHTDKHTQTNTHRQTHTDKHTQTNIHRNTHRETHTDKHTLTYAHRTQHTDQILVPTFIVDLLFCVEQRFPSWFSRSFNSAGQKSGYTFKKAVKLVHSYTFTLIQRL